MAPRKSVTIKDVAAAANVSRATAARALNGYGYVGVAWPLIGVILNLCGAEEAFGP